MEYTIVSSPDLANFVTQVNEHLQDGWELHGESAYTVAGYSQAMTTTKTKGKGKGKAADTVEGNKVEAK